MPPAAADRLGNPLPAPYSSGMSRGLPARWAVVCILVMGMSTVAAAQRRVVAVVDLAGEAGSPAEARAKELATVLANHRELMPIVDPVVSAALIGPLEDHDGATLQLAWQSKTIAEQQLGNFQFALAAQTVERAQEALHTVVPTAAAVQTYAELAFLLGQARLGERNPSAASAAFTVAHRLAPTFAPDPVRYLPEIIEAFDAAKSKVVQSVKLAVTATGRVWIDGQDLGNAPVEVDVLAGLHVVWVTGATRETRGKQVSVPAAAKHRIVIDDAPAADRLLVQRARARLKFAPDPTARAAAMKHLAELLGVGDAVLLSVVKTKVIVQTWRDRAPGFSALREVRPSEPAAELLKPLETPAKVAKPRPPTPIQPLPERVPFYKQRTWQAVIVAGVIGAIAGGVMLYRNRDMTVGVEDPRWDTRELAR